MTILVHDGSPASEYNSYASISDADAYLGLRNVAEWDAASLIVREAALVRATDYIDATYTFIDGPLLSGAVHPLVTKATIVMASHALTDTLAGKEERDIVEVEQELSGVGKKRTRYEDRKVSDAYPMVTKILAPITQRTSSSIGTGKITK